MSGACASSAASMCSATAAWRKPMRGAGCPRTSSPKSRGIPRGILRSRSWKRSRGIGGEACLGIRVSDRHGHGVPSSWENVPSPRSNKKFTEVPHHTFQTPMTPEEWTEWAMLKKIVTKPKENSQWYVYCKWSKNGHSPGANRSPTSDHGLEPSFLFAAKKPFRWPTMLTTPEAKDMLSCIS